MARRRGSRDIPLPDVVKGVPIPPRHQRTYKWASMEIGDAMFFVNRDYWDINVLRYKAQKKFGIKLTMRKLHGGVVGLWRIK
jgi:hypothetical protein